MWDNLSSSIVATITNGISGGTVTGVAAADVLDYEKNILDNYPSITVVAADSPADFADTARNSRQYTFSIKCLQERKEFGAQKAERVLRQLTDELLTLFDTSRYLLGNNLQGRGFVHAAPSRWAYIQSDQIDVRLAEILLVCEVIQ